MIYWPQVMKCGSDKDRGADRSSRKEQNMTQKELAAALHVSDRAVSKWERGAGFPDISLLEPLADALGLGVLDLLRGEQGTVPEPEPTIRQALAFLARQAKERTRRKWSQVLGGTCALLMAGFVLFAILDRAGVSFRRSLWKCRPPYIVRKGCRPGRRQLP